MARNVLCGNCPNNPDANEPFIEVVTVSLEDFNGSICDICRETEKLRGDLPI